MGEDRDKADTAAGRRVAGVVLAGGRSRRFGRDKALAPFGGEPLIHWSLQALRPSVTVLAVNGPAPLATGLGLPVVADAPGAAPGPLAGILGALAWAGSLGCSHVLTAPCDTPFLPSDMASRLIAAVGERPVAMVQAERLHPLCAIWRTDGLQTLTPFAGQSNQAALGSIVQAVGGVAVAFEDEAAFANLNTQAEFTDAAMRWIAPGGLTSEDQPAAVDDVSVQQH